MAAQFYNTCAGAGDGSLQDPALCSANSGNAPWVAIEFRPDCSIWVKYVDAASKTATDDFVRLVGVAAGDVHVSADQLMEVAKSICGPAAAARRFAEDFSGILALANVDETPKMTLMVNHPTHGNANVRVTNNGDNRAMIHDGGDGDGGAPPTWTAQEGYQSRCIDHGDRGFGGGGGGGYPGGGGEICPDCMLPPVNGRRLTVW